MEKRRILGVLGVILLVSGWCWGVALPDPEVKGMASFQGFVPWTFWEGTPRAVGSVEYKCNPGGSTYALEADVGTGALSVPVGPTGAWDTKFNESPAGTALEEMKTWTPVAVVEGDPGDPWAMGQAQGEAGIGTDAIGAQLVLAANTKASGARESSGAYSAAFDPWSFHDFAPEGGAAGSGGFFVEMPMLMMAMLAVQAPEAENEAWAEMLIHAEFEGHLLVDVEIRVGSSAGVGDFLADVTLGDGVVMMMGDTPLTEEQVEEGLGYLYDSETGQWWTGFGLVGMTLQYELAGGVPTEAVEAVVNVSCNSYAAAPEPGSFILLGMGMLGMWRGRRR